MTRPDTDSAASPARRPAPVVKARIAVYLTFLANGLGFSNLVPRYPELLAHLGITKAAFGQASCSPPSAHSGPGWRPPGASPASPRREWPRWG